jgi:hypothetical protein
VKHAGALACLSSALAFATAARALEPGKIGGEPVLLDVTESSSVLYNFDNRDFKPHQAATLANDDWGLLFNRLSLQANAGKLQAGLRLDSAWFFTSPDPLEIALELERNRRTQSGSAPDPYYFRGKVLEAGGELSNRYIDWSYPTKYYAGYTSKHLELTLGDYSAQFGRGMVLSVRKLDELSSDTTLRGLRLTWRTETGKVKWKLTALGGSGNPLRIDEASGRYLGVHSSVTPGFLAVSEAGMPRAIETDFAPDTGLCRSFATCSYAPDRLGAAQVELALGAVKLGTQGSLVLRQDPLSGDVVRSADTIATVSQSFELNEIGENGAAYLEVALQRLEHGAAYGPELDPGYAAYASLSLSEGPLSLLFEGKHYRRLFPLLANVSIARASEFASIAYSAPPTAAPGSADTELEGFNTCVSGGRLSGDVALGRAASVYGRIGHYRSWAESRSNESCEVADENLNRVWDATSGLVLGERAGAHVDLGVGGRLDETERELVLPQGGTTTLYYLENQLSHQLSLPLGKSVGFELNGLHRRRRLAQGGPGAPWLEGSELASLSVSSELSLALGFEYDTRPELPPTYVNGQVVYRFASDASVSVFAGQRRGALRCVGGVCRVFPPFEGARLDLTARF